MKRITDQICELIEACVPALTVQHAVPRADRLEYEVSISLGQTDQGPAAVCLLLFTLPSPILGQQLSSWCLLPVGLLSGDSAETNVRDACSQALQLLAQSHHNALATTNGGSLQ